LLGFTETVAFGESFYVYFINSLYPNVIANITKA